MTVGSEIMNTNTYRIRNHPNQQFSDPNIDVSDPISKLYDNRNRNHENQHLSDPNIDVTDPLLKYMLIESEIKENQHLSDQKLCKSTVF